MTAIGPIPPRPKLRSTASVVISTAANGESDAINLTGLTLAAVQMSSAWTAANLNFMASVDGSTYGVVHGSTGADRVPSANVLSIPTTANRYLAFDPGQFTGVQWLKLVSGTTAGAAVAQVAPRTLQLILTSFGG